METKRLMRSRSDRMFLGVAGGLGAYLNIDPVLVRLFFVFMTVFTQSPGILIYLLLAILMPDEPKAVTTSHDPVEEEIVIKGS